MFIVAKRLNGSRCHLVQRYSLGPGDIVLDRDPAPPQKRTHPPNFRNMSVVMAGWIKMPLGTEVGLVSGHVVLDGDPAPLTERGTAAPATFLLCKNGS